MTVLFRTKDTSRMHHVVPDVRGARELGNELLNAIKTHPEPRSSHRKSFTRINSSVDESIRVKHTVRPSRVALRPSPTAPRLVATVVVRDVAKS